MEPLKIARGAAAFESRTRIAWSGGYNLDCRHTRRMEPARDSSNAFQRVCIMVGAARRGVTLSNGERCTLVCPGRADPVRATVCAGCFTSSVTQPIAGSVDAGDRLPCGGHLQVAYFDGRYGDSRDDRTGVGPRAAKSSAGVFVYRIFTTPTR